ncbi:hypothetical protein [Micromonospora maritima]|uniref:hypothetical protein n=1 Tax=Micromonospora maritima TaxID=986711 RepID=UPI00157D4DE9|nr:hypothetical protein [Micromonospora maritima]
MNVWDWVTVIGLIIAAIEVLVIVFGVAWWFAKTLSEVRSINREVEAGRRRMMEDRIRDVERRARKL